MPSGEACRIAGKPLFVWAYWLVMGLARRFASVTKSGQCLSPSLALRGREPAVGRKPLPTSSFDQQSGGKGLPPYGCSIADIASDVRRAAPAFCRWLQS